MDKWVIIFNFPLEITMIVISILQITYLEFNELNNLSKAQAGNDGVNHLSANSSFN